MSVSQTSDCWNIYIYCFKRKLWARALNNSADCARFEYLIFFLFSSFFVSFVACAAWNQLHHLLLPVTPSHFVIFNFIWYKDVHVHRRISLFRWCVCVCVKACWFILLVKLYSPFGRTTWNIRRGNGMRLTPKTNMEYAWRRWTKRETMRPVWGIRFSRTWQWCRMYLCL